MRLLSLALLLSLGLAAGAQADPGSWFSWHHHHHHLGAPAPMIGTGIPTVLAVGGVLAGWTLYSRRRKSSGSRA